MSRRKIIDTAMSFLGMTYDANNNIIFITDYYGKPMNRRIAYCCMYVWDIMRMAGESAYFFSGNKTASCTQLLNFYRTKHPTWVHKNVNRCKPGDLVFYQFDKDSKADHIGFFETNTGLTSSYFYAVEGNTSNKLLGSQDNGGYVMRKKRNVKQVLAFVSLDFAEDHLCPYNEPVTTVTKGTKGNDARWVQWWLNQKGYPCDIDGSFGNKSVATLKKFQAEFYPDIYHLEADGRCGAKTRKVLKS